MSLDELQRACELGEEIAIAYHGGTQPGTKRSVTPLRIKENYLYAVDAVSGLLKQYRIDKVEIPIEGSSFPLYSADAAREGALIDQLSLEQMTELYGDDLRSLGWHVIASESAIKLSSFFKNGKPKKAVEASIEYQPLVISLEFDLDAGEFAEQSRPSARPWRVSSAAKASRAFSRFSHAWSAFMLEARSASPLDRAPGP